jgi:hypothetical protein
MKQIAGSLLLRGDRFGNKGFAVTNALLSAVKSALQTGAAELSAFSPALPARASVSRNAII